MMLTQGIKVNVFDDNEFSTFSSKHGVADGLLERQRIAFGQELERTFDAFGRSLQTFTGDVLAESG